MKIFDNPVNHWVQRRKWLKGGLHHALIAAALLLLARGHISPVDDLARWLVGWMASPPSAEETVALLACSYYWFEPVGYLSCKRDHGVDWWRWSVLRDPLTDALWPTGYIALHVWAGPWVAVPALLGAGLLRWAVWSIWGR